MPQFYLKMDSSDILWWFSVIISYTGAVSPTHCVLRGIMVTKLILSEVYFNFIARLEPI